MKNIEQIAEDIIDKKIEALTNEVLDGYNDGIYTLEDLELFFKEKEKALSNRKNN